MAILGDPTEKAFPLIDGLATVCVWRDGPNVIGVWFDASRVRAANSRFATPRETLNWYAKKGAEKIGVELD
jgi:hypothetical protein